MIVQEELEQEEEEEEGKEKEERESSYLLEELPDDVLSLVFEYVYSRRTGYMEKEEEPEWYSSPPLNWEEFMNGIFLVSKTMRKKAIVFARNVPVYMSMISKSLQPPVSIIFGCKYQLRPRSLILADMGYNIPIFAITSYLLESIDLSSLKHLKIEEIWDDESIYVLQRYMKRIIVKNTNSDITSYGFDLHEGFSFDGCDEIVDVGEVIASALEHKKENLCIDSLNIESRSMYTYERLVHVCSHTLTKLKLNCYTVGGNLNCCHLLKDLTINIDLKKLISGEETHFPTLTLPPSLERLSMCFTELNHDDGDIDADELMQQIATCIQHLPNLRSLEIASSVTLQQKLELSIESESLERLELAKDSTAVDIVRCICPSLKEIQLCYDHDIVRTGIEGHGEDLVEFGTRIVPQILQPFFKKEFSKSVKIDEGKGFMTYCMSILHKRSNIFLVHDNCEAKFKVDEPIQSEDSDEDLDLYDHQFIFDIDSEDEGDFFTVSSYLAHMRGIY